VVVMTESATNDQLRERAVKQLKKRRDFYAHVLVYLLVNFFIVAIWAMTSNGFFWPIFPIGGWGIGLVMNAWDVWHGADFSEEQITREMAHLDEKRHVA
jgi:hypothetical protein